MDRMESLDFGSKSQVAIHSAVKQRTLGSSCRVPHPHIPGAKISHVQPVASYGGHTACLRKSSHLSTENLAAFSKFQAEW